MGHPDQPKTLSTYDELVALDLSTVFPEVNADRLQQSGIRPPTMGEIRLIVSIFDKEPIANNLVAYIKQLAPKKGSLIKLITSWNQSPSALKEILAPSIADTIADTLSVTFQKYTEEAILYKNTLLLATQNMIMSKRGPSL
ncbi:MAG: hypothetical protein AAB580_01395 [Patescibacteria group bacterium]